MSVLWSSRKQRLVKKSVCHLISTIVAHSREAVRWQQGGPACPHNRTAREHCGVAHEGCRGKRRSAKSPDAVNCQMSTGFAFWRYPLVKSISPLGLWLGASTKNRRLRLKYESCVRILILRATVGSSVRCKRLEVSCRRQDATKEISPALQLCTTLCPGPASLLRMQGWICPMRLC